MAKAVLVIDMPERCTKCPLLLTIPQKGGAEDDTRGS